jgi:hypothetical protein
VQALVATPSQAPPQALPSVAHAARPPCGAPATGMHVPTDPSASHAWHWPPHAALQQTPSAQRPEWHSAAPPQTVPRSFENVATTACDEVTFAMR